MAGKPDLSPARLIVLAGPTAVGKSELAIRLGEQIHGEIVSVDSMQVYRGMDIGTAKPTPADRARIRHHLIDVAEVSEPFDAARFATLARAAIQEIQQRNGIPILCGGTGLYFNALLKGLGPAPSSDPALRTQLEALPLPELLRELQQRDPVTYDRIDRQNPRRVIRALEVVRLTGRPFSAQRSDWKAAGQDLPVLAFGLQRPVESLRRRIERRVDAMFKAGLVDETRQLLRNGLATNRTASQALGYRQVIDYLNNRANLPDTIALVKTRTSQFAKRQLTWFRRQLELEWVDADGGFETVLAAIPTR